MSMFHYTEISNQVSGGSDEILTYNVNFSCPIDQSKEECDYLIKLATPYMTKSTVVDSKTGKSKDSRYYF